ITAFKDGLMRQLLNCSNCIVKYYQSKAELRQRYENVYDKAMVKDFFDSIYQWDARRMAKALAENAGSMGSSIAQNMLFESLYEGQVILIYKNIADAASSYIRSRLDSNDILNIGNVMLPGFITFCFSPDAKIREWSWRSIKIATNKNVARPASSMVPIFAAVLHKLASRLGDAELFPVSSKNPPMLESACTFDFCLHDVWKGLRVALCRLPHKAKAEIVEALDGFAAILCGHLLKIDGPEFVDALRAFAEIIGACDSAGFWADIKRATRVTPRDFVRLALRHPVVLAHIRKKTPGSAEFSSESLRLQDRVLRPILEWVTPFVLSLELPRDTSAIEALLSMLLLDFCEDREVPPVHSVIFVYTAIAIIRHCLKLPKAAKFDKSGMFILADFINRNVNSIVLIAQGHSPLSQCEKLILQAEDLIDSLLRENLNYTFEAVTQTVEAAQVIKDDPESMSEVLANIEEAKPTVLLFPALLYAILQNPRNVEVVHKSLFAASFLLLFDPVPRDLVECLPSDWRQKCRRFQSERDKIANMAQGLLQLLAEKLDMHDVSTRIKFEADSLTSYLRLLISPSKLLHPVVLRILRGGSQEPEFGGLDDSDIGLQSVNRAFAELDDSERDMLCYSLFDRHKEQFIGSLTEVAKSCRVLVNNNRPAYTCASNIALLASSSISAVSGLIDPGSSEAMARLFFEFCGLLGSILKMSSGSEAHASNWSIYKSCVLAVFRTVYNMLNAIEFSHFVLQVKNNEGNLCESDTIGSLSTCVAQMFSYLGGADELNVASEIIQMFGLVASGLEATLGTSMLYPRETVQDLIRGRTGHLSSEQRRHLKSIMLMPVWESRPVAVSKDRPVRIIIDRDEERFASLKDEDFDDVLNEVIDLTDQQSDQQASQIRGGSAVSAAAATMPTKTEFSKPADAGTEAFIAEFNRRAGALTIEDRQGPAVVESKRHRVGNVGRNVGDHGDHDSDDDDDDDVVVVQTSHQDALAAARRRQQTKMDKWFSATKTESGSSLTSQLSQRKAAAASAAASSTTTSSRESDHGSLLSAKPKKASGSSVFNKLRSSYVTERKLQQREAVVVPKQLVGAPRSMATATASANTMAAGLKLPTSAPASVPPPMYVRNSSKAAIAELEKEQKQAASRKV
ncbi:DEAD-box type RNA helicase, partial [Coemansia sp. RSA 2599]